MLVEGAPIEVEADPNRGKDPPRIGPLSAIAFGGVTFSVLAGQILFSRLFAGIMTYYYAFMLISLAMLGLATGALIMQLAPRVFRRERLEIQGSILSIAMGAAAF